MTTIGVTGHQNIPEEAVAFVKNEIIRALDCYHGDLIGISSLAAGADQLFAEAVLNSNGGLHIVVPCQGYESTFKTQELRGRFRYLLSRADKIQTLTHPYPSEEAFLDAGRQVVKLAEVLIAVWDGQKAKGKGGTADIVAYAREQQVKVIVIWPAGVDR